MTTAQALARALARASAFIDDFLVRPALVILVGSVAAVIILQIIFRFIVNDALSWADELARYLMVWVAGLGGTSAFRAGTHLAYTNFARRAAPLLRLALAVLAYGINLTFLLILIRYGWHLAFFNSGQISPALSLSMFWPYAALPTAAGLMALYATSDMARALTQPSSESP